MTTLDKEDSFYRMVFTGHTLPGIDEDLITKQLAILLKIPKEKALRLIAGKRRYIKRVFSYKKAISIHSKVLKIGVECELVAVDPKNFLLKPRKNINHKSPLSAPVNFDLEHADGETMPVHEKSYGETMAELQAHRQRIAAEEK